MRLVKLLLLIICLSPLIVHAATLGQLYAGRLVLNSQADKSLWFVDPRDHLRYPVRSADDLLKSARLGAIAMPAEVATATASTSAKLLAPYAGAFLRSTDGAYWFVGNDKVKYALADPALWLRAQTQALPLRYADFLRLHTPGKTASIDQYSSWEGSREVKLIYNRTFKVDIIKISLDNPKLKIITDTASLGDCPKKCPAKSVANFALADQGFAAVNATYFNTTDALKNYYFFPVYNSRTKTMINRSQLKYWTTGPLFAFDEDNVFYFFKDSREFSKAVAFDAKGGATIRQGWKVKKLQAAIGNKPRLIQDKMNYLIEWDLDEKQMTGKSVKNALAYVARPGSKGELWIVSVRNATVPDLGEVLVALGVDFALNLDGGGSTAVIYNDEMMLGPGRDVPNAIIFSQK
ncbi:MAG: phosphodiester glycosidase family protein [Candidatus Falkowbacteria bacterium]